MHDVHENCPATCKICEVEFPPFQPPGCDVAPHDYSDAESTLALVFGRYGPWSDVSWSVHYPRGANRLLR